MLNRRNLSLLSSEGKAGGLNFVIDVAIFYEEEAPERRGNPERKPDRDAAGYRGFAVRGHARAAPKGSDVVCAAVSSVSQMVALGLLEISRRYPSIRVRCERDEGHLECVFWRSEGELSDDSKRHHDEGSGCPWMTASFLVEMLEAVVFQIAEEYPSRINVRREGYKNTLKSGKSGGEARDGQVDRWF